MKQAIDAVYENGAFRPVQPDAISLDEGQRVRITVDNVAETASSVAAAAELDSDARAFLKESEAYDRLLPGLLETDRGKFVAIHDGRVVDRDSDRKALARRIEEGYRGQFVLLRQVGEPPLYPPTQPSGTRAPGCRVSAADMLRLAVWEQEFLRENAAFERLLPKLLVTDRAKFVAVYEGRVIDKDADQFALGRRLRQAHRGHFVLIQQVVEETTVQPCMDSPEVATP